MPSFPLRSLDGNLLLEALDHDDRALLTPYVERREVGRGDVLFRAGDDVSHVTFPAQGCVVTLVVPLQDGKSVETATVGREGAIGGVVSHGYLPAFGQAVVQVAGPVIRIDADRLAEAKHASKAVRDLFVRYADCLLAQVLQSVACNAAHTIERRCLRWLLTLQDRLGTPDLPVTHEVLADMLGVRRAYLTGVLGRLRREGLIEIGHRRLTLPNRERAEAAACECHAAVRHHFAEVLGAVYAPGGRMVAVDASEPDRLKPPSSAAVTLRELAP
ncbi:Crp/Fnr family transcriptional regulator [Methylobacterium aquaticum]|uniref:Crp/Fnr family transcriptional regulator n=1 Tax=Methylobacterium aquaticum TaxID=270351 RepID=UPI0019325A0A|nr:Crp/Fnr family transcriptional regulator [Methylobacterium aquaticum]QRE74937.1 Crp/Fnr family transcriptional regulator [Methylobacterium aquaticum]